MVPIKMNPQYLLFGVANGEVEYDIDEETYLLGIFTSEEQANKIAEARHKNEDQVHFFNENEDECNLYLSGGKYEKYLVYDVEDGHKLYSNDQLAQMTPVRWCDLRYKIVCYWGEPVHVIGTTYTE